DNDRVARRRDFNLFVGKKFGHLFAGGGDIDIDAQIETAGALQFVPDEQRDFAGSKTIDQNLRGGDDQGVGDTGIGDGDALESFGGIDEDGFADHDAQ